MSTHYSNKGYAKPESGPDFEARRQRVIDVLTDAYASDSISVEEYETRAASAAAANLAFELDDLIADLPVSYDRKGTGAQNKREPHTFRGPSSGAQRPAPPMGPPRSVSCVMGDRRMAGNWLDSDKVNSYTVMGSVRLDLRDAALPEAGPIRIHIFILMGETVIIVPPDLPVQLSATPFMGDAVARRTVDQNVRGARRWVEVSGLVVMGSVIVKSAD